LKIGSRELGNGPLIVAEIGTAHGGSLEKAYRLIDSAVDSGADCIKFQLVYADEIIHSKTGKVKLPGGEIDLYAEFKSLERNAEFYGKLKNYVEERNAIFLCTPFGIKSARVLRALKVEAIKIASPELNHFPLLREVSGYNVPVILSTGVSKLCDIERALELFKPTGGSTVLLHCVTSYPAPEEDYNLNVIENLQRIFGVSVGVSDHSLDPVLVPVLSVLQGAVIIEKHFTLSRKDTGLDDPVALEPDDFRKMVNEVKRASGEILEKKEDEIVSRLSKIYGTERVNTVLGDGVKRLSRAEESNYGTTNRSVHALKSIKAGDVLSRGNTGLLRTEKNLKTGMDPVLYKRIIGKRAVRDIEDGAGIVLEDLFL